MPLLGVLEPAASSELPASSEPSPQSDACWAAFLRTSSLKVGAAVGPSTSGASTVSSPVVVVSWASPWVMTQVSSSAVAVLVAVPVEDEVLGELEVLPSGVEEAEAVGEDVALEVGEVVGAEVGVLCPSSVSLFELSSVLSLPFSLLDESSPPVILLSKACQVRVTQLWSSGSLAAGACSGSTQIVCSPFVLACSVTVVESWETSWSTMALVVLP